jgi:hypothetical protein
MGSQTSKRWRKTGMPWRIITPLLSSAIIAFGLPAYSVLGQESTESPTKPERRWLVTLSLGTTSSGPAGDIESAMVASGFDETLDFLGKIEHPFSRTGIGKIGNPWMISLNYALRPHEVKPDVLLGLIVSDAPIGMTLGLHEPFLLLDIDYSVFTISPTVSIRLADVFHLGIGPALYKTECHQTGFMETVSQSATKVGALFDLGLSFPAHSRFFAIVSVQYRYVGNMTIGPFESKHGDNAATMPAISASYNHYFVSVGMGIRL